MTPDTSLQTLLHELARIRGLDFRGYKTGSLERRLRKRMAQVNVHTYGEYLDYFRAHPAEIDELLAAVLINVTEFFRDPQAWQALRTQAFPLLFRDLHLGDAFRAWCAGCASGEEVYSLAILLAEHFGSDLPDYDIKIYATDHDEEALNLARRGEYLSEQLHRVKPEWRSKYFQGGKPLRVNRELRRLVIFGRSNLVSDAPISHVNLLVCRNVLIYFDLALQTQVMERLRYALEEGGILFLGRSESQLRGSDVFEPVNSKWRIFRRIPKDAPRRQTREAMTPEMKRAGMDTLKLTYQHILETLHPGVLVLSHDDIIGEANDAALRVWDLEGARLVGKRLLETPIVERCPEIAQYLQRAHGAGAETQSFLFRLTHKGGERILQVTVRPIIAASGERPGTLVYAEDVTANEKLHSTVEQLEATAEELHAANEELETTNEELQSTNEELETTNEELQSTNEELETTNEELHSLNEELETTNDELELRTRDLDELNARYAETLGQMPAPLVVTSEDSRIVFCNTAAQRLLGHDSRILIGMGLKELPLSSGVRQALIRRHQAVVGRRQAVEVRDQMLDTSGFRGRVDVYMRPLSTPPGPGVLIIFDPIRLVRPSRSNKLAKAASGGNSHRSRAVAATSGSKSGIHKGKSTRRAGNTNSKRRSRRRK